MNLADALQTSEPECELRAAGRVAFDSGRYEDAFKHIVASALTLALQWFHEEGITFPRPHVEHTPTELLVGLAMASHAELEERGDGASDKLAAATWMFSAVADVRLALDEPTPPIVAATSRKVAEIFSRGVLFGQIDMLMMAIRLGWPDKLAEHELARRARAEGAAKTNALKASAKEKAFAAALRIVSKNPWLSHEEIAVKVREKESLLTTVRTLTDWVRQWRRENLLSPKRQA